MVFKKGNIPWNKGVPRPQEVREKISLSRKGQHNSPKTEFKRGMIPWNKGRFMWKDRPSPMLGKKHTEETKRKISERRKRLFIEGKLIAPTKGKHLSEETKRKISMSKIGRPNPKSSVTLKRLYAEGKLIPWNKGKPHLQKNKHPLWGKPRTEHVKKKISRSLKEWYKNRPKMAWNKGIHHSTKTKAKIKMALIKLWQNPWYRKKVTENSLKCLLKRPTSLERKIIELMEKHNLPFKYCGNGSFLIGFKNPDFYEINGRNICIEVANRFHHDSNWAKNRVKDFAKYGWKCLIIWWDEIFVDKYGKQLQSNWEENVLDKIKNFMLS
jgi:hypothetical protein